MSLTAPIDLRTINLDQITVGGIPVQAAELTDATTLRLDVDREQVDSTPGATLLIDVPAGALADVSGRGVVAFHSQFVVVTAPEDLDDNGSLDLGDIDAFCQLYRSTSDERMQLDFNGDSVVTLDDLSLLATLLGTRIGDANFDGRYAAEDFVAVFTAGAYEQDVPAGWAEGDMNCDQRFDSSDLVFAWQQGVWDDAPPAAQVANATDSAIVELVDQHSSDAELSIEMAIERPLRSSRSADWSAIAAALQDDVDLEDFR